jgi:hypothetical protein
MRLAWTRSLLLFQGRGQEDTRLAASPGDHLARKLHLTCANFLGFYRLPLPSAVHLHLSHMDIMVLSQCRPLSRALTQCALSRKQVQSATSAPRTAYVTTCMVPGATRAMPRPPHEQQLP